MARTVHTQYSYTTRFGTITIAADGKGVIKLALGEVDLGYPVAASEITNRAATQVQQYFAGKRTSFDVPINPAGSSFQKDVWTALCDVPYGERATAAEIAEAIGKPSSYRSVGTAIHRNPIAIIVPSHRVEPIGHGREAKLFRALFAFEQKNAK